MHRRGIITSLILSKTIYMFDIIKESIIYPFKEKDWIKRYGIMAGILLAMGLVSFGFQLFISFPLQLLESFGSEVGTEIYFLSSSLMTIFTAVSSLLSLPIMFYIFGYGIEIVRNVMKKDAPIAPLHSDVLQKLTKGALVYLIYFIESIPAFFIAGAIAILVTLLGSGLYSIIPTDETIASTILWIFLFLIIFILIFALVIALSLMFFSSLYIFVSTGDFKKAITPARIIEVIKIGWRSFFKMWLYMFVISLLSMFASMVSALTLFLATPVIMTSVLYAYFYLYGVTFKEIEDIEGSSQKA